MQKNNTSQPKQLYMYIYIQILEIKIYLYIVNKTQFLLFLKKIGRIIDMNVMLAWIED